MVPYRKRGTMKTTQPPYRSILVPLDGSPFAEQALPLAVAIAAKSGALVQLALVHHPVPALATALEVPEIEAQLDQEARLREQTYLNGIVERTRAGANVPVSSAVLEGPVAEALEEQVTITGADLIVLTTHGRGPLSRFWLGSVADQLMRRIHVPVLLVRPQGEEAPAPQVARILVALDGSPFAEQAVAAGVALAKPFGAAVALFMAVEPMAPIADPSGLVVLPPTPESEEKRREAAQAYLEGIAALLAKEGVVCTTHVTLEQPAPQAIMAKADVLKVDLVVLASHGAGGFERLVIGSVADKVIRGSLHPTLVVRPPRTVL